MKMPFTVEQFFEVFGKYNSGIFPVQIIFYLLALAVIYFLIKKKEYSVFFSSVLAFFWIWMGIVYHMIFFSKINPAAYIFGTLFILQGIVFVYSGVIKKDLVFSFRSDVYAAAGWIIIVYGMAIYPLLGYFAGHHYPMAPEFSAPCPTTIFTFGILLFTSKISRWIIVIPLVWAVIGFFAALNLNVPQDYGLLISGIISSVMILFRNVRTKIYVPAG